MTRASHHEETTAAEVAVLLLVAMIAAPFLFAFRVATSSHFWCFVAGYVLARLLIP